MYLGKFYAMLLLNCVTTTPRKPATLRKQRLLLSSFVFAVIIFSTHVDVTYADEAYRCHQCQPIDQECDADQTNPIKTIITLYTYAENLIVKFEALISNYQYSPFDNIESHYKVTTSCVILKRLLTSFNDIFDNCNEQIDPEAISYLKSYQRPDICNTCTEREYRQWYTYVDNITAPYGFNGCSKFYAIDPTCTKQQELYMTHYTSGLTEADAKSTSYHIRYVLKIPVDNINRKLHLGFSSTCEFTPGSAFMRRLVEFEDTTVYKNSISTPNCYHLFWIIPICRSASANHHDEFRRRRHILDDYMSRKTMDVVGYMSEKTEDVVNE